MQRQRPIKEPSNDNFRKSTSWAVPQKRNDRGGAGLILDKAAPKQWEEGGHDAFWPQLEGATWFSPVQKLISRLMMREQYLLWDWCTFRRLVKAVPSNSSFSYAAMKRLEKIQTHNYELQNACWASEIASLLIITLFITRSFLHLFSFFRWFGTIEYWIYYWTTKLRTCDMMKWHRQSS